uniref:N-acetyl-D-glucosamine kinase n=1 Tax=Ditylenchus dipsaci TaxID=166011 RepID=A0A915EG78_9BILA
MGAPESRAVSVFAGVEGGATHSTLVLMDSNAKKLGQWSGPALNCLLNGIERTADQISAWIRRIAREISVDLPISSLGMGLSGAEEDSSNEKMLQYFRTKHEDLSNFFFLTSDSVCVAATAFDKGGVVLIAGTGSACRLIKADGVVHSVGGWGHLIGDGGSGFWITMRAIKIVFDCEDGLAECAFDIAKVKEELLKHFGLRNKMELISNILYGDRFEKPRIASFCSCLALTSYRAG